MVSLLSRLYRRVGCRVRMAEKFELLLDKYRRPNGQRWNGQELQDAAGGAVSRSYVSALRNGRIANPRFDKLRALAKAMGFPPELWFGNLDTLRVSVGAKQDEGRGSIAERLDRLFDIVRDDRTGQPYSEEDVARMSAGDLSEEEVEGIRSGRIANPTVDKLLALSEVFEVDPSYFLGREEKPPLLDAEAIRALGDAKSRVILHKSLDLSSGEKDMLIDMIEHLGHLRDANDTA